MEGNLQGLVPKFLTEAGLAEVKIIAKHFPGVDIISAAKI
jgi:hypothetical protein